MKVRSLRSQGKQKTSKVCRHCEGTGLEPAAVCLEFSRSGSDRGQLAKLSEAAGISGSMISRIASGAKTPSLATAVQLAEALGITVDRLIHCPPLWRRILRAGRQG